MGTKCLRIARAWLQVRAQCEGYAMMSYGESVITVDKRTKLRRNAFQKCVTCGVGGHQ